MTTITLELSDALVNRAGGAARILHRPLEDVLAAMLDAVLPALDDVPDDMQAELVEMTWWDDATLMKAADALLSEAEQQRLAQFSAKAPLSDAEHEALDALRAEYGKITLRKARAIALLSIRSGQRLLADT
ncbi:MAG: hypothetical protein K9L32_04440 [Chromatiaceae bacterium]|nr:hypothetical protein [Chromatiaceae bacterium]